MATKAPAKKSAPKKPAANKQQQPTNDIRKPVGVVKPQMFPRSKTLANGEPRPKSRRK